MRLRSLIFAFYTYSDVNECSAADQLCDTNANCTNTQGSFYCSCSTGFTGDGEHCKGKNKKKSVYKGGLLMHGYTVYELYISVLYIYCICIQVVY